MEYEKLLHGVEYTGELPKGHASTVAQDSRKVSLGAVFVCIKGKSTDGHDYVGAAIKAGAGLVVTERMMPNIENQVVVKDARSAYAAICQNYFNNPAKKLTLIGVSGTNGKTTVSGMLKQMLEKAGVKCGLIGTNGNEIADVFIPAKFTTPEAFDMAALLDRMVRAGCTHAVMEASSQALDQGRLSGLRFALGIFTNLSQDHLDYHGTMEEYYKAKRILFTQSDIGVFNTDDEAGQKLLQESACMANYSYSVVGQNADFTAEDIVYNASGVDFTFCNKESKTKAHFAIPGKYSVSNALAVLSAGVMLGISNDAAVDALRKVKGVAGRSEVIHSGEFTVIRDFAHTADGLEKFCEAMKPFASGKLAVLFGCAGDRDPKKRYDMGAAVASWADEIFLTSDNPRSEAIKNTMQDAIKAIESLKKVYHVEENRKKAVFMALDSLNKGDMLLLCGKGHEDYQAMNGYTVYFNEKELVEEWLKR